MTTQVTVARAGTIGHEEYSLYSSMSEEELIQMAIEQSLTEDSAEQIAAQKTVTAAPPPREPYCQNFYLYPWER